MIQYHSGEERNDESPIHYHTDDGRRPKSAERSYTVRFQVQSPPGTWDMVVSKEVNSSRIQFDYPRTIQPETLLSFKINLGIGERPIEVGGRVLKCEPVNSSHGMYRVVSEFFEMDRTASNRLDAGSPQPPAEEKPISEIPL